MATVVPQLGVLHKHTEGGKGAENEAVLTVEESVAQDKHPEKTPQWPKTEVDPRGLFFGFV